MRQRLKNKTGQSCDAVRYLGFDVNGEETELILGSTFVSHVPSRDRVIYHSFTGDQEIVVGEWVLRWDSGVVSIAADEDIREWFSTGED